MKPFFRTVRGGEKEPEMQGVSETNRPDTETAGRSKSSFIYDLKAIGGSQRNQKRRKNLFVFGDFFLKLTACTVSKAILSQNICRE